MSIFKDIKNFFQPQAEAPQKPASLGQVLKNAMNAQVLNRQAPKDAMVFPVQASAMPKIRETLASENQILAEARQKRPEVQAGNFFIDMARAIPRAGATIALSSVQNKIPNIGKAKEIKKDLGSVNVQDNQITKTIFGEKPISSFDTQISKAGDLGESLGYNKNLSKVIAAPIIIGSTFMDATGLSGGVKSAVTKNLTDDVVEQLIKSQADDVTEKILRDQVKLPEKAIKDLIPKLTSAQNADEVVGAFGLKKIKTADDLIRTQKTQTSETMLPENQSLNQNVSYNNSVQEIDSPVNKIIKALDEAKPLNKEQQALYAKERSQ